MFSTKTLSVLGAALALAACSSTPVSTPAAMSNAAPVTVATPAAAPTMPAAGAQPTASSTVASVMLPEYLDPKSSLSTGRSVYFDFDEYTVKPEFSTLVERHGKYLGGHPAVAVKVEGSTDERGGSEYNLALGQKRAEALVKALKIYGAKDAQLEAISWGEERPRAKEHDESAWAQNRRADVQYPSR